MLAWLLSLFLNLFIYFCVANHLESQLLAEHIHHLATGAILQPWCCCLLTPQAQHSLTEPVLQLHHCPTTLRNAGQKLILLLHSQSTYISDADRLHSGRGLKYWKASRLLGSVYPTSNKYPQNFSSSGTASSYISATYPFFARSVLRVFSYLNVYLPAHWKMWNFRKLVSKQHQQVNSELALKRWLICRVTTRSDHWPAKKPHISFLFLTIPRILWDWTGI